MTTDKFTDSDCTTCLSFECITTIGDMMEKNSEHRQTNTVSIKCTAGKKNVSGTVDYILSTILYICICIHIFNEIY